MPQGARTVPANLPHGLAEGHCMPGMAVTLAHCGDRRRALADYFLHGHSGFAWAARRSVLDAHGLYDYHILGGGDIVIAHALFGDHDFLRGRNLYCRHLTKAELAAIAAWGRNLDAHVGGSVFYVPGRVLHLWHGNVAHRNYLERLQILKQNAYDPARDVILDHGGCWRWNSAKPELHHDVQSYFAMRNAEVVTDLPQSDDSTAGHAHAL
jgi:hypothetical protein